MNHLKNKVILITGAGSGFGRLLAIKASQKGARIVATDINRKALTATVDEIETAGGIAIQVQSDVTSLADMTAAVKAGVENFGAVDVLVNNAGIMPIAFFSDHREASDAWSKCIDINLKGAINSIIAVHDQMIAQERGHIVNIASILANHPIPGAAVYCATKTALVCLSEALRQESHGRIKVTTVRPTSIPTTGIGSFVFNMEAAVGIHGSNFAAYLERQAAVDAGKAPAEWSDPESIKYAPMDPEYLVEELIHAINQPWGVCIGDVTVRSSGDMFAI